jgi:uncharacterized protein (DUF2147 family)
MSERRRFFQVISNRFNKRWFRSMMNIFNKTVSKLVLLALLISSSAFGADGSPVGLWKTIDDQTGKPRGLVRITEINGQYQGSVEKSFPKPGEDPNPKCEKCEGARRNQPVLGMTILWGLQRQGDEYQGGEILDPETGKVYRVKMKLEDNGKKLDVRGFIGFSLFGRSQTWLREE